MNQIRPNVRWQSHGAGATASAINRTVQWDEPTDEIARAINRRAYAVTGLIVLVLVTLLMNLDRLPEWWGGFAAGVITLMVLLIAALVLVSCLGGARQDDPPRTGDRGAHR